jgi:hypothetical protein
LPCWSFRKHIYTDFENIIIIIRKYFIIKSSSNSKTCSKKVTIKNRIISLFGQNFQLLRLFYRPRPFQRAQICEEWSLGTEDMWRQQNCHKVKNMSLRAKIFTFLTNLQFPFALKTVLNSVTTLQSCIAIVESPLLGLFGFLVDNPNIIAKIPGILYSPWRWPANAKKSPKTTCLLGN